MHQIRFQLGLRNRLHWGSHSDPQTTQLDLSGLLLRKEREEKEKTAGNVTKGKEGKTGKEKGVEKGGEVEGRRKVCFIGFGDRRLWEQFVYRNEIWGLEKLELPAFPSLNRHWPRGLAWLLH